MALDYLQVENDLTESLIKLEMAAKALDCDDALRSRLLKSRELVANRQYRVAVMGEFNRGKSALINALLGGRILPEAVVPATATVNRVTYGMDEEAYAVAQYVDGRSEHIPVDQLKEYVTKITRHHEEVSRQIREVTVYTPSIICQNHIDLIDTPGLNENERMTQITLDLVKDADAAIIPLHARAPFSGTERDFVIQLVNAANIRHVLFVVTFMDQLDEEDYEYEEYMAYIRERILAETEESLAQGAEPEKKIAKFHAMVGSLEIVGISAKQALDAFASGDRKKLKRSRFEEFRTRLVQALTAQQAENAICQALETIDDALVDMQRQHEAHVAKVEGEIQSLADVSPLVGRAEELHLEGALNNMLDLAEAKIDNRCGMLVILRPNVKKAFITQLAGVRQNKHAVILSALKCAAEASAQYLNEQYQQLLQKLLESLDDEYRLLEEAEARTCAALAEEGLAVETDFEQERWRLEKRASWILGNFGFDGTWLRHCGKVKNLADHSVSPMALVEEDIDSLFTWYGTGVRVRERLLLGEWRAIVDEGHAERVAQAQAAADQKAAELQTELLTAQRGWVFYQTEMRDIQESCAELRRGFSAS